jgi:hypothetical protein
MIYEEIQEEGQVVCIKLTTSDNKVWWIPLDLSNRDYREYLAFTKWATDGNEPDDFWIQGDKE